MEDCIFCKISKEEIPCKKVNEDENFLAFLDVNPQVEGHTLIMPKKHFETILDMPSSAGAELLDCVKKTALKLIDETKAEGFNVLNNNFESAGQVVKHVHFHILPRKKGDGFRVIG